jgi:integrase
MLPEKPKSARVLTPEEKLCCWSCRHRDLIGRWHDVTAVLALNTTMMGCELKGLRWKDVNLFEKSFAIQRQSTKTDAGARVIPLNRGAVLALANCATVARNWDLRHRNILCSLPVRTD